MSTLGKRKRDFNNIRGNNIDPDSLPEVNPPYVLPQRLNVEDLSSLTVNTNELTVDELTVRESQKVEGGLYVTGFTKVSAFDFNTAEGKDMIVEMSVATNILRTLKVDLYNSSHDNNCELNFNGENLIVNIPHKGGSFKVLTDEGSEDTKLCRVVNVKVSSRDTLQYLGEGFRHCSEWNVDYNILEIPLHPSITVMPNRVVFVNLTEDSLDYGRLFKFRYKYYTKDLSLFVHLYNDDGNPLDWGNYDAKDIIISAQLL